MSRKLLLILMILIYSNDVIGKFIFSFNEITKSETVQFVGHTNFVNSSPFLNIVDCLHFGYYLDGGGWTLVRHAPGGYDTWHPATDDLAGTDVYGDSANGPMSRDAWSIVFDAAVTGYDELLFSSGDCTLWLIVKKEQLAGTLDGSQS